MTKFRFWIKLPIRPIFMIYQLEKMSLGIFNPFPRYWTYNLQNDKKSEFLASIMLFEPILKFRFVGFWSTKTGFRQHYGHYKICFPKVYPLGYFHLILFALLCRIGFYILKFVIFTQIINFTVFHVWARSSSG